ncbi:hypothetical protein [Streptomyces aurantiacus]|uniref:hypothetical protein n=1 Tax=Streptomyces aurantiacus TaxID=47760 RepID=UPI0012FF025D|nr:hypothetical protein [Streptomyces aurantiacus]
MPEAPGVVEEPAPVVRVRRRGRTTLLIAAGAVLGLVAGTCAGYLVQANREPTKLPSLSQPSLPQAKGKGPQPLSAAQDRRVRTDGDLRKLLIKRPSGTRDITSDGSADGWLGLAAFADGYTKPTGAYRDLIDDAFRRAAITVWRTGRTNTVVVRLVQYRQEEGLTARDWVASELEFEAEEETDNWTVPGTSDGMAYVRKQPETKAGYLPMYSAEAHAWRGDIAMQIFVNDTKPISKAKIMDLAERQMERL